MNTYEISKCLKIVHHSIITNVFAANRLPIYMTPPVYLICNLDPDTKPGSHWIAIFINANGIGEYFDSFGRKPESYQLAFLKRNAIRWTYNSKVIQNFFSSLCGEYCLMYLYLKYRGICMRNFENIFTGDTYNNDVLLKGMFKSFFCM